MSTGINLSQTNHHCNNKEEEKTNTFLTNLLSRFQGDFDNYDQVCQDRKKGMGPKEGGGHEHFHVTLLPLDVNILPKDLFLSSSSSSSSSSSVNGAVLASYYFNGTPSKIFRLRLYTFVTKHNGDDNDHENNKKHHVNSDKVEMKLYTLSPDLEGLLRQNSEDALTSWIELIHNHCLCYESTSGDNNDNGDDDSNTNKNILSSFCTELKRCDILWTKKPDPTRHVYFHLQESGNNNNNSHDGDDNEVEFVDPSNAFHAIMINDHDIGGVLLDSQMIPGLELRIQDELSLWEDELWVNDRGHNAETGDMVYGNYLGVPYKMKRVASLQSFENGFCREIVNSSLSWTLGNQYRTDDEYHLKMKNIEVH